MKKILIIFCVALLSVACSSKTSNTKNATSTKAKNTKYIQTAQNSKNAKYQIIDQEFDNMLAPEKDYDTLSDYELQACGASYLPPGVQLKKNVKPAVTNKAKAKQTATDTNVNTKKVTNVTNVYYVDGPVKTPASTSYSSTKTTTTTTTSDASSSSSSSSSYED